MCTPAVVHDIGINDGFYIKCQVEFRTLMPVCMHLQRHLLSQANLREYVAAISHLLAHKLLLLE